MNHLSNIEVLFYDIQISRQATEQNQSLKINSIMGSNRRRKRTLSEKSLDKRQESASSSDSSSSDDDEDNDDEDDEGIDDEEEGEDKKQEMDTLHGDGDENEDGERTKKLDEDLSNTDGDSMQVTDDDNDKSKMDSVPSASSSHGEDKPHCVGNEKCNECLDKVVRKIEGKKEPAVFVSLNRTPEIQVQYMNGILLSHPKLFYNVSTMVHFVILRQLLYIQSLILLWEMNCLCSELPFFHNL